MQIRQKFFNFYIKHNHSKIPSSSLIPANDPTLLFANAGMNQFKDIFLGKEKRNYTRAVTIQKCMRAGGKHNDLDNVGRTSRHLTFFEMLGNFSFGDYFKEDAIRFAWNFLTHELELPAEKLYISVYEADDEAYQIWHKHIGLPADHIVRLGRRDNFWQMGDTGPCGPCSEIYFDRGAKNEAEQNLKPGDECERFLEIWNLVFMQFDRQADGRELPLESKGIDTGMGLERLCTVLQSTDSVFETDIFAPILRHLEKLSGKRYTTTHGEVRTAFRVLADHIRSTSLAIADGGMPSNEGRGYVLRKIIRRAALFSQKLGNVMFFAQLAPTFIDEMGQIYPELQANRQLIVSTLTSEIEKFMNNLVQGQAIVEKYLQDNLETKRISGEQAFKLYDTFGFPLELTVLIASEKGYSVDESGFEDAMNEQREQSGKKQEETEKINLDPSLTTEFVGYETTSVNTTLSAIIIDGQPVTQVNRGTACFVVTKQSPFYTEGGGQVSDTGILTTGHATSSLIRSVKRVNKAFILELDAPEKMVVGDKVTLTVDIQARKNTARNHTATHLLQAALISLLGTHVKQAGSLVSPDYLRFDFTHHENISEDTVNKIEAIVNKTILENIPVKTQVTTYKEAVEKGVIAFFGEKYNPESVRVVEVVGTSAELCGGTHVHATGEIGLFKITSISSLSVGVKRITAVTGTAGQELFDETFATVKNLAQHFKVQSHEVVNAVEKLHNELKNTELALQETRQKLIAAKIPEWTEKTTLIHGIPFGLIIVEGLGTKELRELAQMLLKKKPGFYFIFSMNVNSIAFFATRAPQFTQQIDLRTCAAWLMTLGFKGGSTNDSIQGGVTGIPDNFQTQLQQWLEKNSKV